MSDIDAILNPSPPTSSDLSAAVRVVGTLAEAIRAAGEIPSGHLYALTLGSFSDVGAYERAIGMLKRAGLVEERGHVLRWVGPEIKP